MSGTCCETQRDGSEAMGEGSFGGSWPVESCFVIRVCGSTAKSLSTL
jgi:hypothetical protein